MTAVAELDIATTRVQNAVEDRNEHRFVFFGNEERVQATEAFTGIDDLRCESLQKGAAHRHENRSRHPLAGNIPYDEREPVIIQEKKIIKISPDFFGGNHLGKNVELRSAGERWECPGKDRLLDPRGDAQVSLNGDKLFVLGERFLDDLKMLHRFIDRHFEVGKVDRFRHEIE